jgi:PAS domain S-box-containing protein
LTRTKAISGSVLVVAACSQTEALLEEPVVEQAGLTIDRATDPDEAIARVEAGEGVDVVVLAPGLADPVRVAQRLHSLDRDGAVVVLAMLEGADELRHALEVAPFLSGDVTLAVLEDAQQLVELLTGAAARTQARREQAATRKKRRATPPPLSASYLGTLLDSVPLGIVTLDAEGRVIGWNKRTGEMLGTPEVEALGRPFAELFADADRDRLGELIEELGSEGIGDEGQVFWRDERAFELTGARFSIRSGERGTLLILQDVTKRMLAEREVDLQRALMAAQADSSMAGIAVVSLDGWLERMNKRWTEIWGIDADAVRNDRERATRIMLDQVTEPERFLAGTEALAATGGGEFRDEVELKDGRVIERYATHVHSEAGEVIGRIWFHTDITSHRREEDALRFLADATNLLSSSLDYEETLQHISELVVPWLADRCSIDMVDATDTRGSVESGEVIRTGDSRSFRDGSQSVMIVPIKVRDRVFGAIAFVRAEPYDDDDLQLAEELARRAAIAIDNSRVHAELRNTARTLQESLLPPHLPEVPGLELAARFRPAGAGMQVGGDFYDVFETTPGRWGVAVGDVCGKGAEAAALTALTRYTVRAAAMYESEPAGVLRVLNEALLRQRGDYRFTTLTFSIIEMADGRGTVRCASGGHPQPLLLRPDGTTDTVGGTGPLLGVMADADFGDEAVQLEAGDVIVFYTDGLTDALAPERILGEKDLMRVLAECQDLSAGEISEHLELAALGGDPDRVPRDDIALVVARLV